MKSELVIVKKDSPVVAERILARPKSYT